MNIFDLPTLPIPQEITHILAQSKNMRIERIISTGQVSGWYDQSEYEFVILLQGSAQIEYDTGNCVYLEKGSTLLIKPHERHRVSYTCTEPPCIWLCVFWI